MMRGALRMRVTLVMPRGEMIYHGVVWVKARVGRRDRYNVYRVRVVLRRARQLTLREEGNAACADGWYLNAVAPVDP